MHWNRILNWTWWGSLGAWGISHLAQLNYAVQMAAAAVTLAVGVKKLLHKPQGQRR